MQELLPSYLILPIYLINPQIIIKVTVIISHIVSSLVDEQDSPITHPITAPINTIIGLNSTNFESLPNHHSRIDHKYTNAGA